MKITIRLTVLLLGTVFISPVSGAWEDALKGLKEKALQGDGRAEEVLAELYMEGEGVRKDAREARYWAEMAAMQGRPRSQNILAKLYASGEGGRADLNGVVSENGK